MTPTSVSITLEPEKDATAEELSEASISFRDQLLETDIESISLVRDSEAPPGTKALDALALGHLVAVLVPSGALIQAIASVARAKINAGSLRKITLRSGKHTLELSGASASDQQAAIQAWLDGIQTNEET